MRRYLVIPLMIWGIAAADPSDEALEFMTVPGAESILPQDLAPLWDSGSLEPELRKLLARVIMGDPVRVGDEAVFVEPAIYRGFSSDLNGNGDPEHFVLHSAVGGSGGSAFELVSRDDGVWRHVGGFQAVKLFLDHNEANGPVLVVIGRGGGGHFVRRDHEFIRGAWRVVRRWDFDNGVITENDLRRTKIHASELPYPPLDATPARSSKRPLSDESGKSGAADSAAADDVNLGQKLNGEVIPARTGMFLLAVLLLILAGLSIRRLIAR